MSNDIPFPTIKEDSEDNKSTTTFTAFPLSNSSFLANRPSSSKRRPTAFYGSPNPRAPPQPFSKSAAKRESVMALGSIQHLQHLYAKKGLASKSRLVVVLFESGFIYYLIIIRYLDLLMFVTHPN